MFNLLVKRVNSKYVCVLILYCDLKHSTTVYVYKKIVLKSVTMDNLLIYSEISVFLVCDYF